jgi:hypothetical protein
MMQKQAGKKSQNPARTIFMIGSAVVFFVSIVPQRALGGAVEISVGGSYNRSSYSGGNYSWTRRWGASFGYHLTELSEIEVGYQDIVERTQIVGYEDTTFHDQIYSVNWVQGLLGKDWAVQPYAKAGVGQLNRDATGTYASGGSPPVLFDSLTGILGAGTRIYFTRSFALRVEATSYLTGGDINTWQDNFALTAGLSLTF